MARNRQFEGAKQVARAIELLQGKGMIEVLYAMRDGPIRLGQLRRIVPDASKKALTARLRLLQNANIVVRNDFSSSLLHVEYELSPQMRQPVASLLSFLIEWSSSLPTNVTGQDTGSKFL